MIVVDNTFLSLLLHPQARAPKDPSTGQPIARLADRLEELIEKLAEDREEILIPAPVLSEFLILADKDGPKYLSDIDASQLMKVVDFDQKAAVELAVMNLAVRRERGKKANRRGDAEGTWAKISFDRQIVAIAKANGAHTIYSDDGGLEAFAKKQFINVIKTWRLPLPAAKQIPLPDAPPKAKRALAQTEFTSEDAT